MVCLTPTCLFWCSTYRGFTPGVAVADNSTWRVSVGDSDPQPDAMVFVRPDYGGGAYFDKDGCVLGTPEFVAEVAASSASYDLNIKRELYLRNRVAEYVVWLVNDNRLLWFELHGNEYQEKRVDSDGIYRSVVFPGLWLDPSHLFDGDLPAITRLAQRGTSTSEHSIFAAKLRFYTKAESNYFQNRILHQGVGRLWQVIQINHFEPDDQNPYNALLTGL